MKAARWYGQRDVRVDEVEPRDPNPNEVRIRVDYAGICATDLHEYTHGPQLISTTPHPMTGRCAPLTMGHEFTGTVVDVGRGVIHLKKGDRVVAEATLPCGECDSCKREQFVLCRQAAYLGFAWDGVFAEYCTIPARVCHKVPDTLDSVNGVLTEPLATGMHAVRRGRVQIGESVAVIGAGTIGLCSLLSALAAGASRVFVVDPIAQKRTLAIELGTDRSTSARFIAPI
ncbi:MAG: alcohol dehydrogenase catalytic domain-containing protein [Desulfobacteraceae bacterium]|nr:MAG: alcohol dehydrogenase catalytic domain-containing protein [Desulfobacteraceae bacterium]